VLGELVPDAPPDIANCAYYVANVFQDMYNGNLVHPSTAIVRRERLQKSGPFEPEVTGPGAEDYHFYFRISAHGPVAFLDAPTTLFRLHPLQMSTFNRVNEARSNLTVVQHWLQRHPPAVPEALIRDRLAKSHAWLGAEELSAGNARSATRHLWQSFRLRAKQRTAALLMISLLPYRVADVLRGWKQLAFAVARRRAISLLILLTDEQDVLGAFLSFLQPEFIAF
jgi:hypothetical protein